MSRIPYFGSLLSVVCSVMLVHSVRVASAAPEDLLALLQSRTERFSTLSATLKVVHSLGPDYGDYARVLLKYAEYRKTHWNDSKGAEKQRQTALKMIEVFEREGPRPEWFRLRYVWQAPGRVRMETLFPLDPDVDWTSQDLPEDHVKGLPDLWVFVGDEWRKYRRLRGPRNDLRGWVTIENEIGSSMTTEVSAVCLVRPMPTPQILSNHEGTGFDVSERSLRLFAVPWDEWLTLIDPTSAREKRARLPGSTKVLPVLVVETPTFKNWGVGLIRFRIWFDPEQDWEIVAMEAAEAYPNNADSGYEFVPTWGVRWTDYQIIDGHSLPGAAQLVHYTYLLIPDEHVPEEKWRRKAFATKQVDFVFEDVRINQPVDESLFELEPPPGAMVYDNRKGYRYVVGDAGEQLKKTAMPYRTPPTQPPREEFASRRSWWVLVAINAAFLLAIFAYLWVWRRRRAKSQSSS